MILHPFVFWTLFGCLLVLALYPLVVLFALWCDSFKVSCRTFFLSYAKEMLYLTLPLSGLLTFFCIFWLGDVLPHLYIIDHQNNVKCRYLICHNSDIGVTPAWETCYVKNESNSPVYEYRQGYSNRPYLATQAGIVSEIMPGKVGKLSQKPASLMEGIPDKFTVRYRTYMPTSDTEVFIISKKQMENMR